MSPIASAGPATRTVLAEGVGCAVVDWPIEQGDPFININNAEDMAAAEMTLGRRF